MTVSRADSDTSGVTTAVTPSTSAAHEVADMMRYLVFLSLFLIVTVGVGSHSESDLPYKVTEMLDKQLRDKDLIAEDSHVLKRFQDIKTILEFHQFLTGPFYDVVYGSDSFDADWSFPVGPTLPDRDTLSAGSKIIGQVRIGQVRVKGLPCPGAMAQLSSLYSVPPMCYGDYTTSTESSETFGLQHNYTALHARMAEPIFYAHSYHSFPSPLFAEFFPSAEDSSCDFETHFDCSVYAQLAALRTHKYFDRATRAIFIDFALYDMHIDHVTTVRLFLEHFQGGGLAPQVEFLTYRVFSFETTDDWVQFGLSILLLVVALYQLYAEVSVQPDKLAYLRQPSNLVQLSNYVAFVAVLFLRIASDLALPTEIPPHTFVNFRTACTYYGLALNCHSFCCLLSWLKLFKFLSFIPMFGQLTRTVQRSASQVVELLIIFFMCLLGAALAFTLGFGNLMYDYHSITASFYTLLHIVTGDIPLEDLSRANRFTGPFFFMIYMFMMMFIILNIFIVIVEHAYTETKEEMKLLQDMQLDELSKEIVHHFVHNMIFQLPIVGTHVLKPLYHRSMYATTALVERISTDMVKRGSWKQTPSMLVDVRVLQTDAVAPQMNDVARADIVDACYQLLTDLESLQSTFVPELKRRPGTEMVQWEHDAHAFTTRFDA
ncbi:hypothetical protein SDRG_05082 [Saprolegnia diclina VS20]|uniref:Uncharacterized protein n=1 Tax=Saprolegnia diclina (strain VS20) TaxID=1156394 RepID=T0QHR2_SAPDV|nr:hypothetical protein SDRG_05082 [Saprolegnia diclina VS20]EQC37479.1 hypothetical protein SDRG_05082 [Saprolegnia diclina VS20]|eukprot:XP_008608999.1 hypothetical protein SDRG_05082 [Saprolegnia diclina VS20]